MGRAQVASGTQSGRRWGPTSTDQLWAQMPCSGVQVRQPLAAVLSTDPNEARARGCLEAADVFWEHRQQPELQVS